jgi:hypothetical protein
MDDEMGRECGINSGGGERERIHVGFWCESQKERDHYKVQDRWVDNIKLFG